MKLFRSKTPWYAGGLAFECLGCGRCCAGPEEGYVWITPKEIDPLAEHLKLPVREVRARYVRRTWGRLSLREDPETKDCVFLQRDGQGQRCCAIYPVRPTQCRTWPFWPGNLRSPDRWCEAAERCPGINRGPMHPCDEVTRDRNRTDP